MIDRNHPLTETDAAELWDTHAGDTVPWDDWYGGSRRALTSLLRAAHDAGREYERAAVADLTAQLDAERFAHANTAVKVKRMEELADRLEREADVEREKPNRTPHDYGWDDACTVAAYRIRAALNGGAA